MSPDVVASVRARLLNKARQTGEEFELFLVRYACERFLYRLGASALRERYILKGAGLLRLWIDDLYRATRDLDFLALGSSDPASVEAAVRTVCDVPCPEDGLSFDLDSLEVSPIRADEGFEGQRVVLRAYLGKARMRLQIDFGFGDAVTPGPADSEYPTLLDGLPHPRLRTYPPVVAVAEKLEAMVHLGRRNSRMKDFHDIWALSSELAFDGPQLREAVAASFERRGTVLSGESPAALGTAFYSDPERQARWRAYIRAGAVRIPPPAGFEVIGERVGAFLGPVRRSIVAGEPFEMHWDAGGPWRVRRETGGGVGDG